MNTTTRGISTQDYDSFKDYLARTSGITLGENKQYLITSRLNPLLKEHNLATLGDLVAKLKIGGDKSPLRVQVVDAMTTNETSWFRDNVPYDILKHHILPEMVKSKVGTLKIWSSACSSGQEPYSINMVLREFMVSNPGGIRGSQIIATDISPAILKNAKLGYYDNTAVSRGLKPEQRANNFKKSGDGWQIRPEVKANIRFQEFNLKESFTSLGKFDIIFCRNVLIYFSHELKGDILSRFAKSLNPGGYLFLGSSESVSPCPNTYDTVRKEGGLVYQLKDDGMKRHF